MNTEDQSVRSTGKAEETRGCVLDATLDLFRRKGFDPTTMREIPSKLRPLRRKAVELVLAAEGDASDV